MNSKKLAVGIALAFGGVILMSGEIVATTYAELAKLAGVLIFIIGLALVISEILEK